MCPRFPLIGYSRLFPRYSLSFQFQIQIYLFCRNSKQHRFVVAPIKKQKNAQIRTFNSQRACQLWEKPQISIGNKTVLVFYSTRKFPGKRRIYTFRDMSHSRCPMYGLRPRTRLLDHTLC